MVVATKAKKRTAHTSPKNRGSQVSLQELIKLQAPARTINLHHQQTGKSHIAGDHRSRVRGQGLDIDDVRIYQPGDPISNMAWRVTARTGKPHTKIYHEERERPVYVVVDYSDTMFFGTRVAFKSVVAAKAAALLGWSTVHHGDRIGGLLFSGQQHLEFRPRGRRQGILPLLKALSRNSALNFHKLKHHDDALDNALQRLNHVVRPGSLVVIISDFMQANDKTEQHFTQLSHHSDTLLVHVYDALETIPPPADCYSISNGRDFTLMDTGSTQLCKYYRQQFIDKQQYLQALSMRQRTSLIELATHNDVAKTLQQSLR